MNELLLLSDTQIFWGQSIGSQDILLVLLLVFFEGILSIDNAIVLGLLAKRLPESQRKRALSYGLAGAFVFRTMAVLTAGFLLEWRIVKLLGGGYLLYIALKHLFFHSKEPALDQISIGPDGIPDLREAKTGAELSALQQELELQERLPAPIPGGTIQFGKHFWLTVLVIELTDIAFAVDSILAALALVGTPPPDHPVAAVHPKLWVILAGGVIGLVLMRVAAFVFIRLLEKFPRFESSAYFLIVVIALKLLVDWFFNSSEHPHVVDFHQIGRPEFWIFWVSMLACLAFGFSPRSNKQSRRPAK